MKKKIDIPIEGDSTVRGESIGDVVDSKENPSENPTKTVSKSEQLKKIFSFSKEIGKTLAKTGVGVVTSIGGIKSLYDVPAYFSQRYAVRGMFGKGKGVQGSVEELLASSWAMREKEGFKKEKIDEEIIEGEIGSTEEETGGDDITSETINTINSKKASFAEDRDLTEENIAEETNSSTDVRGAIKDLNKRLAKTKEGSQKGSKQRRMLAQLIKENRLREKTEKEEREKQIKEILDDYTTTKVTGVQASKETLNTFLVASGAFVLRGLSYAGMDVINRTLRLKKEAKKNKGKISLVKNVIIDSIIETLSHARGKDIQGEERTKAQKVLGAIKAWGLIARYAGLSYTAANPEIISDGISKVLDSLEGKTNLSDIAHNFEEKIESVISVFSHHQDVHQSEISPTETLATQHAGATDHSGGVQHAGGDNPETHSTENRPDVHPDNTHQSENSSVENYLDQDRLRFNSFYEKFCQDHNVTLGTKLDDKNLEAIVLLLRKKGFSGEEIDIFLSQNGQDYPSVVDKVTDIIQKEHHFGLRDNLSGHENAQSTLTPPTPPTSSDHPTLPDHSASSPSIHGNAGGGVDATHLPTSSPEDVLGLKNNFTLKLGQGNIPGQLERVFHMMSVNSMKDVLGKDHIFGEEEGTKSLNVAANLVRLAQGHNVPGIKVEDFSTAVHWNSETSQLEIKDYQALNKIIEKLDEHADKLWSDGVLEKGATAYLDDIKESTWDDIVKAEGLDKVDGVDTGIIGHDHIDIEHHLQNFDKSEMVSKAEKISQVAPTATATTAETVSQSSDTSVDTHSLLEEFSKPTVDVDSGDLSDGGAVAEIIQRTDKTFAQMDTSAQAGFLGNLAERWQGGGEQAEGAHKAWEHFLDKFIEENKTDFAELKNVKIEFENFKRNINNHIQKIVGNELKKALGIWDQDSFKQKLALINEHLTAKEILKREYNTLFSGQLSDEIKDRLTEMAGKIKDIFGVGQPEPGEKINEYLERGQMTNHLLKERPDLKESLEKITDKLKIDKLFGFKNQIILFP